MQLRPSNSPKGRTKGDTVPNTRPPYVLVFFLLVCGDVPKAEVVLVIVLLLQITIMSIQETVDVTCICDSSNMFGCIPRLQLVIISDQLYIYNCSCDSECPYKV